ncbi:hypothetical protein DACRYDRAFT_15349 [Dacryopinax primogenitus]|uniref:Uncharacterized protein n=1 Tax=Dacryopinax primogenitus (strain DJM 731) TaxID=1858805 RepID=M5GDV5_DACPD|nr:uncharacterized protein DACRYDRAFT_15349 [Dacryopinax primogenitus]EJU02718.1 hypothetical protein DACRYDRAFT_15349 [Dacryopinax primogenitus]
MPHSHSRKSRALLTAYGDSFVGPLELLGDKVIVKKYSGASAKGLNNPKSVSQTGQELLFHMDRFRPPKDLQVVYLYKVSESERLHTPPPDPDAWVQTVFSAYSTYLRGKILPHLFSENTPDPDRFVTHLYISSVTAPTVPDEYLDRCSEKYNESAAAAWQEAGIKLSSARAATDLETRRRMVRDFNRMLEEFCKEAGEGVYYVDLNPRITDPLTGEVLPPYLVPDKSTIHVVWETTIGFWVDALQGAGLTQEDVPPDLEESLRNYEEDKRGRMDRQSPAPRRHMRYSSANIQTASPGTPTQPGSPWGTSGEKEPTRSQFESRGERAFSHMRPRGEPGKERENGEKEKEKEKKAVYIPPHSRLSTSSPTVSPSEQPFSPTLSPSPTSRGSAGNGRSFPGGGTGEGGGGKNVVPQDDPRRMGSFVHGYGYATRRQGSTPVSGEGKWVIALSRERLQEKWCMYR